MRHRLERDTLDVGDPARPVQRLGVQLARVRAVVVEPGQAGAALEVVLEGVVEARDHLGELGVDLRGLRLTAQPHRWYRRIVPVVRAAGPGRRGRPLRALAFKVRSRAALNPC